MTALDKCINVAFTFYFYISSVFLCLRTVCKVFTEGLLSLFWKNVISRLLPVCHAATNLHIWTPACRSVSWCGWLRHRQDKLISETSRLLCVTEMKNEYNHIQPLLELQSSEFKLTSDAREKLYNGKRQSITTFQCLLRPYSKKVSSTHCLSSCYLRCPWIRKRSPLSCALYSRHARTYVCTLTEETQKTLSKHI